MKKLLRVGYLGPEGTFSEEAANRYEKKIGKADFIPYSTIHDVVLAVEKGKIDEAVVPIENSIEGTVGIVLDLLTTKVNLKIVQEIILPIRNYLLVDKKVKALSEITDVISHPQPIDQCKEFLRHELKKIELHLAYSTADAAREVSLHEAGRLIPKILNMGKGDKRVFAAIAPFSAAKMYGLKIIKKNIQDYQGNATRFVVLAKKDHLPVKKNKTSIVFSSDSDRPGVLFDILKEFADRKINLTKIESRPSKRLLGDYFFYLDLLGHRCDKIVKEALKEVKKKASFFKVLGSYPKAARLKIKSKD